MLTEVDLANPKHELYPGMYADVTLELERHRNALEVPATAVGVEGDARFVYVVRDGQLAKLPVTTGISDGGSVEIASGLVGEEQVVTSISPALTEGGKVARGRCPGRSRRRRARAERAGRASAASLLVAGCCLMRGRPRRPRSLRSRRARS